VSGVSFVLMGIGNADHADDGVGILVARLLKHPAWLSLDCGSAPENLTHQVRASKARTAVLVDAVEMGLLPGEIRRIPAERIADASIGSHDLPLSRLIEYLSVSAGISCTLIGIQPGILEPGGKMSPEVESAARRVAGFLETGRWAEIAPLA